MSLQGKIRDLPKCKKRLLGRRFREEETICLVFGVVIAYVLEGKRNGQELSFFKIKMRLNPLGIYFISCIL
jgi:hypothetical protein